MESNLQDPFVLDERFPSVRAMHFASRSSFLVPLFLACAWLPSCRSAFTMDDPALAFARLEDRLAAASVVSLEFHVTAEGAVAADLRGSLRIEGEREVHLRAQGSFAGQDVRLSSDWETRGRARAPESARQLREAILVGWTRMGILHNLARLSEHEGIDHAEGGVREWVTVGSFRTESGRSRDLTFDLSVAGRPAGTATLKLGLLGDPMRRRQTVHFPSGDMRVVEEYSAVSIRP
ncbi:MAG TPA: hypothetical protein ENJ09_13940 [Planctomycetes bacterium]|nr:hypothetical protein [Planctomycetota bacterium]